MKRAVFLLIAGVAATGLGSDQQATESISPGVALEVTYENLSDLGNAVSRVGDFKDNFYQYEEQVCRLMEVGQGMQGQALEVVAVVERVTPYEVFIDIPKADKTRLALRHQRPPFFGNFGSRVYPGPPSTVQSPFVAKPVALRIGEEISLSLAKQLRKNDRLLITGTIELVHVRIKSVFDPHVAAIVTNWKVSEAVFATDRLRTTDFGLRY